MANPYPWKRERTFKKEMEYFNHFGNFFGLFMAVTAVVFSPLSLVGALWAFVGYRAKNDSPKIRPKIMMLSSLVLGVLFYVVLRLNPVQGFMNFMMLFGDRKDEFDAASVVLPYLFFGLPASLLIAGMWAYFDSMKTEWESKRYLRDSKLNPLQKHRIKKAKEKFENDELSPELFEIGAVKTDVLPWRQNRRGMIVGTEFKKLKHGYIIGANGTGKTIAAMNIAAEYVDAGWAIVFPDFKGDRKTENMLAAIAREKGVPFYSFWSNDTDTGFNYDPLNGVSGVSPASIIITAFDFDTEGAAAYYTDQAEKYLALQFSILGTYSEKKDDESNFDWLLRTIDPDVLKGELKKAAGSSNREKAAEAKRLMLEVSSIKRADLSRLEANLSKLVNTIGPKMRPSEHMIDFRKTAPEGAIVYFGIPSTGDKTVMRALGALIIRDLVSYTSERHHVVGADVGRPLMVMPDEASQLQEKADAMLEILQQGRSAKVFLFPAMQTFGAFSEKFIRELLGNSPTPVILRVSDEVTARRISENMGTQVTRTERMDTSSNVDALGEEHQLASGSGSGTLMDGPRIPVRDIMELKNQTAMVYFPESSEKATIKVPRVSRIRKDESTRDIPTVYLFSRRYILEAEDDLEVTRMMLNRSLNGESDSLDEGFFSGEMIEGEVVDEVEQGGGSHSGDPFGRTSSVKIEEDDLFDMPEDVDHSAMYESAMSGESLFEDSSDDFDAPPMSVVDEVSGGSGTPVIDDFDDESVGQDVPEEELPVVAGGDVVPSSPSADDFVESDDFEDGVSEGEDLIPETSVDHVEKPTDDVQRYQGASSESDKSEGKSADKSVEESIFEADEPEDDDGTW